MRAAQCRPVDRRTAVAGFFFRLRAALGGEIAQAGLQAAVAAVPELRARHRLAALRQDRRRRDAVFVIFLRRPGERRATHSPVILRAALSVASRRMAQARWEYCLRPIL